MGVPPKPPTQEQAEKARAMLAEHRTFKQVMAETGMTQWQVQKFSDSLKQSARVSLQEAHGDDNGEEGSADGESATGDIEGTADDRFTKGVINALASEFQRIGLNMTKDAVAAGLELFRQYATTAKERGYTDAFAYVHECIEFADRYMPVIGELLPRYRELDARHRAVDRYLMLCTASDVRPGLPAVIDILEGDIQE